MTRQLKCWYCMEMLIDETEWQLHMDTHRFDDDCTCLTPCGGCGVDKPEPDRRPWTIDDVLVLGSIGRRGVPVAISPNGVAIAKLDTENHIVTSPDGINWTARGFTGHADPRPWTIDDGDTDEGID